MGCDGIIAYVAPCIGTTRGHSVIQEQVVRALRFAHPSLQVATFQVCSQVTMATIVGLPTKLIVVDWPEIASLEWLEELRMRMQSRIPIIGLMMRGIDVHDPVWVRKTRHVVFTTTIGLEPGIMQLTPDYNVSPLVQVAHVSELPQPAQDQVRDKTLIYLTGQRYEWSYMLDEAYKYTERGNSIVSTHLEQPASRYMRYASRIIAGAGYSTCWELAYLDRVRDTHFLILPRPVEDIEGRIGLLRSGEYLKPEPGVGERELALIFEQF
jgi:hypothetical protein